MVVLDLGSGSGKGLLHRGSDRRAGMLRDRPTALLVGRLVQNQRISLGIENTCHPAYRSLDYIHPEFYVF